MVKCVVIYDDIDVQRVARNALQDIDAKADVLKEFNLHDGMQRVRTQHDQLSLVIVGALVRQNEDARAAPGDYGPVCDFVRTCMREFPSLPVLVLSPSPEPDPGLAGLLSAHQNTGLVSFDADIRKQVALRSAELLRHTPARSHGLDLVIDLFNAETAFWTLAHRGRPTKIGGLKFKSESLRKALAITDELELETAKSRSLDRLGALASTLEQLFFTDEQLNRDLWLQLTSELSKVGGAENMRVVFTTFPNEMERIPVEALRGRIAPDYWMLQAPIVRQYGESDGKTPLFGDAETLRKPVNCLIIAADPAKGDITDAKLGWSGELEQLVTQKRQARALETVLNDLKAKDPGCIGEVKLLQLDGKVTDPMDAVVQELARGEWQLVHFVGHAVTNASGEGGLVLAASPGSVLPFSGFAAMLPHTRFLFVSGCRSATPGFIQHAASKKIPAVLGYRWNVGDFSAYFYARAFYEALFQPGRCYKSLDYAFLEARKAVHKRRPHEATWTAPVLVTQLRSALH